MAPPPTPPPGSAQYQFRAPNDGFESVRNKPYTLVIDVERADGSKHVVRGFCKISSSVIKRVCRCSGECICRKNIVHHVPEWTLSGEDADNEEPPSKTQAVAVAVAQVGGVASAPAETPEGSVCVLPGHPGHWIFSVQTQGGRKSSPKKAASSSSAASSAARPRQIYHLIKQNCVYLVRLPPASKLVRLTLLPGLTKKGQHTSKKTSGSGSPSAAAAGGDDDDDDDSSKASDKKAAAGAEFDPFAATGRVDIPFAAWSPPAQRSSTKRAHESPRNAQPTRHSGGAPHSHGADRVSRLADAALARQSAADAAAAGDDGVMPSPRSQQGSSSGGADSMEPPASLSRAKRRRLDRMDVLSKAREARHKAQQALRLLPPQTGATNALPGLLNIDDDFSHVSLASPRSGGAQSVSPRSAADDADMDMADGAPAVVMPNYARGGSDPDALRGIVNEDLDVHTGDIPAGMIDDWGSVLQAGAGGAASAAAPVDARLPSPMQHSLVSPAVSAQHSSSLVSPTTSVLTTPPITPRNGQLSVNVQASAVTAAAAGGAMAPSFLMAESPRAGSLPVSTPRQSSSSGLPILSSFASICSPTADMAKYEAAVFFPASEPPMAANDMFNPKLYERSIAHAKPRKRPPLAPGRAKSKSSQQAEEVAAARLTYGDYARSMPKKNLTLKIAGNDGSSSKMAPPDTQRTFSISPLVSPADAARRTPTSPNAPAQFVPHHSALDSALDMLIARQLPGGALASPSQSSLMTAGSSSQPATPRE